MKEVHPGDAADRHTEVGPRQKQDHRQHSQDDRQAGWGVLFSSGRRTPPEGWEAMDAEALEQRRRVLNQITQHLRSAYLGLRVS